MKQKTQPNSTTVTAPALTAAETTAPVVPGKEGASVRSIFRDAFKSEGAPGDEGGDEEGDGSPPPGDAGSETDHKSAPKTLADIAERLGVKVEELYEIEFGQSVGDGAKARKLGELKDVLAKGDELDTRELEFEEKRVKSENEVIRARQELAYVLEHLPASAVTEDLKQRATHERARVEKVERARVVAAIPSWVSKEAEEADRDGMAEFMTGYGFHATDVDRVTDHRMLKLLRDAWQRETRVRAALEKVEEHRTGAAKPGAKTSGAAPQQGSAPAGNKAASKRNLRASLGKILRG